MAESASATSAKYLNEIKAIYERLKGEYDYLRKKQEQFPSILPEELPVVEKGIPKLLLKTQQQSASEEFYNLDSDGLETDLQNARAKISGAQVDEIITSSVEELMESENASLRERIAQLENDIAVRSKEWRRIRTSYEQLQETNEKLKKQLEEANADKAKIETKYKQLSNRFANLQACKGDRGEIKSVKSTVPSKNVQSLAVGKTTAHRYDYERLLNLCLEATAEVVGAAHQLPTAGNKVIPSSTLIFALAELLRNLPPSLACQSRVVDPLLRIFYESLPWTLTTSASEEGSTELRPGVSLSLQKCGETLFKCSPMVASGDTESSAASATSRKPTNAFFRSPQLSTRFLSTLIILRTVTRADILAQALDCLLRDCQAEAGCEAFMRFDAARVIVMFMRPHNKAFVGTSLAIVARLLTTAQLPGSNSFAEVFITERFVCALSMLLDSPNISAADLEKLSIILVKLAATARKPKSSGTAHRLFNAFGITETIQKMLKRLSISGTVDAQSAMISSNFRQVLGSLHQTTSPSVAASTDVGGHLKTFDNNNAHTADSSMAEDLSCGSLLIP